MLWVLFLLVPIVLAVLIAVGEVTMKSSSILGVVLSIVFIESLIVWVALHTWREDLSMKSSLEVRFEISDGGMPTWMAAYLAAYIVFSLWAFKDDFTRRRLTVMVALEAVGSTALIFAALAYWYLSIRYFLSDWAAVVFIVGLFILLIFITEKVRATFADAQLSRNEKIWFAVSGVGSLVMVNLPLIWFGSQSLFNYR